MTERTRTPLVRRVERRIDEEFAAASLRSRLPFRKHGRRAAFSKGLQRFARKEPLVRLLKPGNRVELLRRGRDGGLPMTIDRSRGLSLQVRVSHVVHQRRVESRRVHGTRDAAREDHRGRGRIIHQDDPLRELALDQDRCVGGDPRRAAEKIVQAVMKEKRVGRVLPKAVSNVFKADRAVSAGMAGSAGAAVAAEGFMVEETLSFIDLGCRNLHRYPRRGDERDAGCDENQREGGGRNSGNERSMHGGSPPLSKTHKGHRPCRFPPHAFAWLKHAIEMLRRQSPD